MSDKELQIKIKTALESGGIDTATRKLKDLVDTTKGAAGAAANHNGESVKAAHALRLVQAASVGNIEALTRLIAGTEGATASLAKAIPVLSAFWAGFQGGKKIGDALWSKIFDLENFDTVTGSIRDQTNATIQALKDLNKVKMSELLSELNQIVSGISIIAEKTGLMQDRETAVLSARQGVETSALESRYSGKDKSTGAYERDRAALEKKHSEENLTLKSKQLDEMDRVMNEKEKRLNDQIDKARSDEATALAAAQESSRVRSLGRSGPQGIEDLNADRAAQSAAGMATQRRTDLETKAAPEFRQLESARYRNETQRQTLQIGMDSTRNKYAGLMSSASSSEQAAAQKQLRKQEEERIARLEKERDLQESYRSDTHANIEEMIGSAQETATTARQAADSFTPSKNKYKSRRERANAEEQDRNLEVSAIGAEARLNDLRKALKESDALHKKALDAIIESIKTQKEQMKNLPIY
ncbi:MAG: hypothetical protein A2283_22940 [Lentisphaerae bacterium RIFOXYA12_FULL_48_11]|nr:MAG: hypothetical protein A2283_22940 [Lentisphaerae bacterium RIFOXYA12_FULL_48_11]